MNPYVAHINKVQDYIERNLARNLNVKQLAEIANFSEFHFQKIYSLMTGETLYGFIKRIRLEKAAYLLLTDKSRSISEIATSVGFSNQSSFAKAFKSKYGISSSDYRKAKLPSEDEVFSSNDARNNKVLTPNDLEIRYEDRIKLIYARYTGPYKGDSELFTQLFNKLYQWASKRSLLTNRTRWFVIYHDFGSEPEEEQLRLSVCCSITRNVALSEGIGLMELQNGMYAVGSFMLREKEYAKAWHYMYTQWLPLSDYIADDRFSFEHYPESEIQGEKRLVEIYIPITKMIKN